MAAEESVRSGQDVKSANERTAFDRSDEEEDSAASNREDTPFESTSSEETLACFNGKLPSGYLPCAQTTHVHTGNGV